jgi:hypothetical protein
MWDMAKSKQNGSAGQPAGQNMQQMVTQSFEGVIHKSVAFDLVMMAVSDVAHERYGAMLFREADGTFVICGGSPRVELKQRTLIDHARALLDVALNGFPIETPEAKS